ncbi:hypothetical protein R1sor_022187 [Riccia sorocarpa]|uniref:SMP-30/Gluconolactonase/LRE-like region domain-containing protein n=1 Tax=Riccia sorocarpa TaxID=122646 RepID=A0ABD3GKW0_9MARC
MKSDLLCKAETLDVQHNIRISANTHFACSLIPPLQGSSAFAFCPLQSQLLADSHSQRPHSLVSLNTSSTMTSAVSNGTQEDSGLPSGVGRWRQRKLRDSGTKQTDYSAFSFLVRDEDFLKLLGSNPKIEKVVDTDAHEGLLYYPDESAILFTTQGDFKTVPNKVKKVRLKTRTVETIFENTDFANGMSLDAAGSLLICQQGCNGYPAYIQKVNLKTSESVDVADNWYNRPFNGPNDIVVKSDGSIWFTDPDYPTEQGFGGQPQVKNHLYRIAQDGIVDVVADKFQKPNGLAFSPDESKLYVTDTGFYNNGPGSEKEEKNRPHSITVFDVVNRRQLSNRRLFASICSFDGSHLGTPDGIKVDTEGRVYACSTDGIHVINADGVVLGLIQVPGAVNIAFGGPRLDTLYIGDDKAVHSVKLNATGTGLFYAAKFHGIEYPK